MPPLLTFSTYCFIQSGPRRRFAISTTMYRSLHRSATGPAGRDCVDDPDVAQHFIEHARRASGAALAAQFVQQLPHRIPISTDQDLKIGEEFYRDASIPLSTFRLSAGQLRSSARIYPVP